MAKQVTRQVTIYKHLFIKTDKQDGKLVVTNQAEVTLTRKLGVKTAKAYIESNEQLTGFVLAGVEENNVTYAMSLDNFIKYGTLVPTETDKTEKTDK